MPPQTHSLFSLHPRSWHENHYVYPVVSRRARGLSIGINLNPDKACNFDCVYCCVDRMVPSTLRTVDLDVLRAELDHMLGHALSGRIWSEPPFDATPEALRRLNDIAFSGDGEPTSYPRFTDACRLVADLLARHEARAVKTILITNATLLDRPAIRQALRVLDEHNGEVWAKLEAGTDAYYRRIERTSVPLQLVLDNIRSAGLERPIVIQSLFMQLDGAGPDQAEIDAYLQRLGELVRSGCRIRLVQVYTVARRTAEVSVTPLDDARLERIAVQVQSLGIPAETYPASA
jgi:wyosine [tRNA(Phe)-imidazoG37] synthetase (radical SAM superfamily)